MGTDTSSYDWLADTPIAEAGCVTLVKGVDLATVAWAFGGDLKDAFQRDIESLCDAEPDSMAVISLGEWVLVVENNGYQGDRPEVLRRLTQTGDAVSFYWNEAGNGPRTFSYASGGVVVATVDEDHFRSGAQPGVLDVHLADLGWTDVNDESDDDYDDDEPADFGWLGLALAERLTGVTLTQAMLEGTPICVSLLPWPEDVPTHASGYRGPLARELREADAETARRVARLAVSHAAAAARMEDNPEMAAVIAGQPSPEVSGVLEDLARRLRPAREWAGFRAVDAARATLSPDPQVAALCAMDSAETAIHSAGGNPDELHRAVRSMLAEARA